MMRMEKSERAELKLNVIKTKIMASSSIISWQTERGKVEVVTDFPFLGSKITEDGDCSHEIRRWLLLGTFLEGYDKPRQRVEKQRHYSANKVLYSQGYGHIQL